MFVTTRSMAGLFCGLRKFCFHVCAGETEDPASLCLSVTRLALGVGTFRPGVAYLRTSFLSATWLIEIIQRSKLCCPSKYI